MIASQFMCLICGHWPEDDTIVSGLLTIRTRDVDSSTSISEMQMHFVQSVNVILALLGDISRAEMLQKIIQLHTV